MCAEGFFVGEEGEVLTVGEEGEGMNYQLKGERAGRGGSNHTP